MDVSIASAGFVKDKLGKQCTLTQRVSQGADPQRCRRDLAEAMDQAAMDGEVELIRDEDFEAAQ